MSTKDTKQDGLASILSQIQSVEGSKQSLPPVEKWNPEFCGDMDLTIKRDGLWYYQGTPIGRQRLVKLFSTVIKKEKENYFLVTPVEKIGITVEDMPFLVIRMFIEQTKLGPVIIFEDNCDNKVILSKENPLWVEHDPKTSEPSPYINIRRNLNALIHRNVFYELIEIAEEKLIERSKHLGIISNGEFFSLGTV